MNLIPLAQVSECLQFEQLLILIDRQHVQGVDGMQDTAMQHQSDQSYSPLKVELVLKTPYTFFFVRY